MAHDFIFDDMPQIGWFLIGETHGTTTAAPMFTTDGSWSTTPAPDALT